MIQRQFKGKPLWFWLSIFIASLGCSQILRLFPDRLVFWSFTGLFFIGFVGLVIAVIARISNDPKTEFAWQKSVEDRLDELERLKRRDMVTPEEYAAKRQEILKDL